MSERLEVRIIGHDGTTRVFQEVARSAQTMAQTVEQSSTRSSSALKNWGDAAQQAGAALGALSLVSLKIAGDAEAAQQRIRGAFENAGIAIDEYQDRISKLQQEGLAKAFDDEDVSDSIASLVAVTKDAEQAFIDLSLAQNIARQEQISLSAATDIVVAAESGRYRSMKALGIVLDETATKEDYLAAAQAKYAGASERFATTGAADFLRWQNTAENALESVGARLAQVQGPLLALSASSTLIGTAANAMKGVTSAAGLTTAALGPLGLAGAVIAAGAGLYLLSQRAEEWEESAESAAAATLTLKDQIGRMAAAGEAADAATLQTLSESWALLAKDGATAVKTLVEVNDQIYALEENLRARERTLDTPESIAEYEAIQQQIENLKAYRAELEKLAISSESINAITADISDLFAKPGINAEKAAADIEWYFQQFKEGKIDLAQLVAWIDESAQDWTRYSTAVEDAIGSTTSMTYALNEQSQAFIASGGVIDAQRQAVERNNQPAAILAGALNTAAEAVAALHTETAKHDGVNDDFANAITRQVAVLDAQADRAAEAEAAIRGYATALGQIPAIADTHAANLAINATAAGGALGDAFRIAVGNTSAIGSQSQQVADWAQGMLDVNRAVDSSNQILKLNAEIQDDILQIQEAQAPVLADLVAEQARYTDHLSKLPAHQQAVRLAYMDSETSAKALEAAQLAAAAAAGELGEAGVQTATNMITAAAEADPYLRALLDDMGLISVGADGTITVNFDSVTKAGATLDDVVEALTDLNSLLTSILVDYTSAEDAKAAVDDVATAIGDLDGSSATIDIGANTAPFNSQIAGLGIGGVIGTAYVNIATSGDAATGRHGGVLGYANGGVVAELAEAGPELLRFRDGGMAWAMERGHYQVPRGTYVTPAPASKGRGAGSPGIVINGPITIVANNPTEMYEAIRESAYGGSR